LNTPGITAHCDDSSNVVSMDQPPPVGRGLISLKGSRSHSV